MKWFNLKPTLNGFYNDFRLDLSPCAFVLLVKSDVESAAIFFFFPAAITGPDNRSLEFNFDNPRWEIVWSCHGDARRRVKCRRTYAVEDQLLHHV